MSNSSDKPGDGRQPPRSGQPETSADRMPVPTAPEAKRPAKAADTSVVLANKTGQKMSISIDRGNGPEEMILMPGEQSAPVLEKQLTAYTKGLVDRDHIRVRPVQL